ncbi:MAG TPA: hypothetical protein VFH38_08320 [Jatrophihabitans sp.]|nr:hypothetical protein [Jatrophihabitans sp.]
MSAPATAPPSTPTPPAPAPAARSSVPTANAPSARLAGRLLFTLRARSVIRQLSRNGRPQCVHVCWPGGVTCLPAGVYQPGPCDVIVAHVAGCPVYADVRQLALFRDRCLVVDAPDRARPPRLPMLRAAGHSRAALAPAF